MKRERKLGIEKREGKMGKYEEREREEIRLMQEKPRKSVRAHRLFPVSQYPFL